ncbi:MAG: sigma-70 family RNA polymerase sigma factor [Clostridia bacterium]|nr:sigma-70 family RNA polymerase sigma factor [Clostridia bacterium]
MNSPELLTRARAGDAAAEETLMRENMGLVKSVAARFLGRGTEFEDLCQLGSIGMLKAIRNFDTSYGTAFSTYAVPLIIGEIKRFLRDDGMIKVSRELRQKGAFLLRRKEEFTSEHGREPTVTELAEFCGCSVEEAVEGLDAGNAVLSFSEPVGERALEDLIGTDNIDELCEREALRQAVLDLPAEEKQLVLLRFYRGYSQQKAGEVLGMTQVKVSRTEKKILEKLRRMLE